MISARSRRPATSSARPAKSAAKLLAALGQEDDALEGAAYGAVAGGDRVERLPPLFPKPQD